MSQNPNPFDDPFFKQHQDFAKTVKKGFLLAVVGFFAYALAWLLGVIGLIWLVIYLLHHYHVFN